MKVVSAKVMPYKLRFRVPAKTASGTVVDREGFILRLEDNTGRVGWGDAAPWAGFGTDSTAVQRTLGAIAEGSIDGFSLKSLDDIKELLTTRPMPPETAHAVELALLDLLAQSLGRSVAELFCDEPRTIIELHALVPDAVAAKEAVRGGARAIKIKIGRGPLNDEITRVGVIRAAIGPDVGLRLDVNGAWDVATAVNAAKKLAGFSPEFLEQPIAPGDPAGLAQVRREGGIAVAVDEGAQRLADLERIIEEDAASVLVVKPMFAGGIVAALALAERAAAAGMKVVVTHALESAVGRVGAMHLAAAIKGSLPACGLGDPMDEDVAKAPVATGGWVNVPTHGGLGVNPSAWFRQAQTDSKSAERTSS